jgi:C4-dicarboxylate-specific signal transduction histidine kinase
VSSKAENTNVRADSGEIRQVLVNMIINGLQAMAQRVGDEPSLIEVSVSNPDENGVRVSVRDHGPGIKEEALDRMFDTFFTTKSEGMGMGLSICRSTLQSYGGQIGSYNHPEKGAVVEFCLPVAVQGLATTKGS